MLLTQTRYYIMNVGDSRAYELTDGLKQLTNDQTFVAREVALGNMTPEQALVDERRNVLLQCVGASDEVYPDMRRSAFSSTCTSKRTPQKIPKKFTTSTHQGQGAGPSCFLPLAP